MERKITPRKSTLKNLLKKASSFSPYGKKLFILCLLTASFSCSVDEEDTLALDVKAEQDVQQDQKTAERTYKGIFATNNSSYRGTFQLNIPDPNAKNFKASQENTSATLTLSSGEEFEAQPVQVDDQTKAAENFKLAFDSEDLSFDFSLDDTGDPVLTNVVFKKQDGAIVAAEETATTTVTPITGIYKCTNCQDQTTSLNGIDLNNRERIFNVLLTSQDGTTQMSIQAFLGILVDAQLAVEENCVSNGDFTICEINSGAKSTTEPVTWAGVHRYTTPGSSSEACSSLSGKFTYISPVAGSIEAEFYSDSTCPGQTYYVSANGNDSNTGASPQDAWQTISKINSLNLAPGDVVLFEGGYSYDGNLYLDKNDANNAANPVRIASYGTGRATINGGNDYGIYAYNTSGVKIDNLIVKGSGMNTNTNSGIYFYNDLAGNTKLDLVEITNCEVYGFKDFGIVIGGYNGNAGFSNVRIENNVVHDCLDVGISSFGEFSSSKTGYAHSNIIVRNCEVYNIKGYDKPKHSGNGILLSDVQNSVIENCTVHDSGSGNTSCGGPVGIWYWDSDQVTIQFCEAYNMSAGSGCDGGGFDLDGGVTNGTMQYNYSHDNDGGGFIIGEFTGARPMHDITVRYNVSENDAATNGGSVYLFNGNEVMKNIYVYNNTLYLSEKSTNTQAANIKYITWYPVKDNINFFNNILYAENGADLVSIPKGYDGNFAGNLYYSSGMFSINYKGSTYTSLEAFRATGNEMLNNAAVGYQGDPLLNDPGNGGVIGFGTKLSSLAAYKLQSGSPAIDAGVELNFDRGERDFYGSILSQNSISDIGAFSVLDSSTKYSQSMASK